MSGTLAAAIASNLLVWHLLAGVPEEKGVDHARQEMIREIEDDVRATASYLGKSRLEARVLAAIGRVPRHLLVPENLRHLAYENRPLPIGEGQTISQPYIVALMSDLAAVGPGSKVLEVGTGSGYQAAVLAELGAEVYTIEIVDKLGREARARLEALGYGQSPHPPMFFRLGDGYAGWPEAAPFDAIVVTAAAPEIPPPLLEQLKVGGKLVIPLAKGPAGEELEVIEKKEGGGLVRRGVLPVRFVPLTRKKTD